MYLQNNIWTSCRTQARLQSCLTTIKYRQRCTSLVPLLHLKIKTLLQGKRWNRIKTNKQTNHEQNSVPAVQQLGKEGSEGKGGSDTAWDNRGHHTRAAASLWLQTKFISLNADMCWQTCMKTFLWWEQNCYVIIKYWDAVISLALRNPGSEAADCQLPFRSK